MWKRNSYHGKDQEGEGLVIAFVLECNMKTSKTISVKFPTIS